jgi:hydrogenase/urease accessory protein HupE
MRLHGLFASVGAFAVTLSFGQWLKTENWMVVSSFLPAMLTAVMGLAVALSITRGKAIIPRSRIQGRTECHSVPDGLAIRPTSLAFATTNSLTANIGRHAAWRTSTALMALTGVLYGGGGLPVTMVLSRSEQHLAFLFSALGTSAGLGLVILCAGQLHAAVAGSREGIRECLRFWIVYLGGVAACAIGLYQATAPLFVGSVTPAVPLATLLGAIALGAWCGAQPPPLRFFLPGVAACMVIVGMVLSLRGISLPQTTLAVNASLALAGLLVFRPVRLPGWAVVVVVAVSCVYQGAHGGGVLRESVALPVAHATAMIVLLVFLFLATHLHAGERLPGGAAIRLFGLATALLAVFWRFAEYRDWIEGEVAVEATMGLFRLPVLTIILALAALLVWPRRRRFQPSVARSAMPMHWLLVLAALFTVSLAGVRVRSPFYTPRAPTAAEARPIMAMLLTDAYLAFNLPDEDAAFDQLARNLSEDLVPGVYLDSRRRLAAGTRKGAEVKVKDVRVMSVQASNAVDSGDESFAYPCKWVVTARIKHWQHIHDRQNIYVGTLTLRMEDDRWKIGDIELLSEEREIMSWKNS